MSDRVTVVVATRNRRDRLLETLPEHRAPVILVDDASTDGGPDAISSAFPAVDVVRLGENRAPRPATRGYAVRTRRTQRSPTTTRTGPTVRRPAPPPSSTLAILDVWPPIAVADRPRSRAAAVGVAGAGAPS
ncbi:hypothetical protein FHR83_004526 [Actinoplanes campanulatus]|uniref:Glycosyl transferase family 2 n=1 Tax=Actinoplanes campanulatus TaxID=113559 RepID=A0A7W5FFY0_9ACTN|nr:hypothetical protein [Actinoplanes campanulatus]MBB3096852.1 hypothetical protein [Actinoplanes campanulatus]